MIKRLNPDIGYFAPDMFTEFGFSQVVRAGDTVHISGIVAARGTWDELEVVGDGDVGAQLIFVLDVLDRCLDAAGLTAADLVSYTLYTTSMEQTAPHGGIIRDKFAAHPPAATWVEVTGLFMPELLLELEATAFAGGATTP